jgi:hypothetical protein
MLSLPFKNKCAFNGIIYHSTGIYTFEFTSWIVIQVKKLSLIVGGMLNRCGPEALIKHD